MQIRAILNPSTYHGTRQKPPFFEGWYFKMVSADEKHKIAIIPGASHSAFRERPDIFAALVLDFLTRSTAQ